MAPFSIRAARRDDCSDIQRVEVRGGERFRSVGMPDIANAGVEPAETLSVFAEDDRSWVAVDDDGAVVGFVLAELLDGAAFVHQVTVDPDRQGEGIGRSLIDRVEEWAEQLGLHRLVLTTFDAHVPWNRPLYEHLGFTVIADAAVGPQLAAVQADEERRGLRGRVAMQREM